MIRGLKLVFMCGSCVLTACSAQIAHFEPCDIRDSDCQSTVFEAVQGARNAAWDPWLDMPPIRVISKSSYFQELEQDRQAAQQDTTDVDYYTPAYKAFHLFAPNEDEAGSIQFTVDNTVAYYNSSTKSVTIIDRDLSDLKVGTRTLAHELVHAAQDRDVSFDVLDAWSQDANTSQARGAIVEGEAVLYANVVGLAVNDTGRVGMPDFASYHAQWIAQTRTDVASSKSPLREARLSLRYPLGSMYMTRAWLQGGALGVRRAIAAHPTSSLAFMLDPASGTQAPAPALTCVPAAPPGMRQVGHTVLGAWSLYAFLTRLTDEPTAWMLAQAWTNDAFVIYSDDAGHLAVVWQLHWLRRIEMDALVALTNKLPTGVLLRHDDANLAVSLLARVGEVDVGAWAWDGCPQ
jgi:hypothetical protein